MLSAEMAYAICVTARMINAGVVDRAEVKLLQLSGGLFRFLISCGTLVAGAFRGTAHISLMRYDAIPM